MALRERRTPSRREERDLKAKPASPHSTAGLYPSQSIRETVRGRRHTASSPYILTSINIVLVAEYSIRFRVAVNL
jgi:hypothetical protein